MASITTWVRLEPRPRDGALEESLQAQMRDPLWMLARQWQFGEFVGENAGSLVSAELEMEVSKVDKYYPGPYQNGAASIPYQPEDMPLETMVEAEAPWPSQTPDYRHAFRAGQMFLHFLRQGEAKKHIQSLIESFPIQAAVNDMDEDTHRFLRIAAVKAPDGVQLRSSFPTQREIGAPLVAVPPDAAFAAIQAEGGAVRKSFLTSARKWLDWYDQFIPKPAAPSAWNQERMEYTFAVSAPFSDQNQGHLVLTAEEYPGGHLDWHAFNAHSSQGTPGNFKPMERKGAIPTPVEFRGMPANRFWQFEEGQVDFGKLDTAPEDLGKLVLAEFALVFGNDFFYIPVTLDVGSISRVMALNVKDTFLAAGEDLIKIESAGAQGSTSSPWRMFSLSTDGTASEYMFLPPTIIQGLEGPPLEEVLLLRDEMANMAWAVERLVSSPMGKAINRHEDYQLDQQKKKDALEAVQSGATAPTAGPLRYHLFAPVPDYWNPLIMTGTSGERRFTIPSLQDARSALLTEPTAQTIFEQEVPRSGARVTLAFQYVRWSDGSRHVWLGRRKRPGRGEGSSGLRFDTMRAGQEGSL